VATKSPKIKTIADLIERQTRPVRKAIRQHISDLAADEALSRAVRIARSIHQAVPEPVQLTPGASLAWRLACENVIVGIESERERRKARGKRSLEKARR
jgi:hypothetical protein